MAGHSSLMLGWSWAVRYLNKPQKRAVMMINKLYCRKRFWQAKLFLRLYLWNIFIERSRKYKKTCRISQSVTICWNVKFAPNFGCGCVYHLPLSAYHLPLTISHLPLIIYHLPPTIFHLPFTTYTLRSGNNHHLSFSIWLETPW